MQRSEVGEVGAEAGRPEDRVHVAARSVRPLDAVRCDPRRTSAGGCRRPAVPGRLFLLAQVQSGHADHALRRQAGAYALLDLGDDLPPVLRPELITRPPLRRPARHPRRRRDLGDLREQLHSGRSATDNQHLLPGELTSAAVVGGVQLTPLERLDPRIPRDERPVPRPGRVHDRLGRVPPLVRVQLEPVVHRAGRSRPLQAALPAARTASRSPRSTRHELVGPFRAGTGRHRYAGQVRDPVHVVHRQRVPPVLPGATGFRVPIQHNNLVVRRESHPHQVVRSRQARLPRSDHCYFQHTRSNAGPGLRLPGYRGRPWISARCMA